MYDPYGDRQQWRAQRRYERSMRRYHRYQNPMRGLAGGLFFLALILAFAFQDAWGGSAFLALLFVGLALASLVGSFSTMHRYGIYGGIHGFIWMLGLALCFIIGFWPWILLPIAVTMIVGALYRPIMGGLAGAGFAAASQMQQPPNQQPYPSQAQPGYQQGYQATPAQPRETYQEGDQSYELSQAPHPEQGQELPPMEQH